MPYIHARNFRPFNVWYESGSGMSRTSVEARSSLEAGAAFIRQNPDRDMIDIREAANEHLGNRRRK